MAKSQKSRNYAIHPKSSLLMHGIRCSDWCCLSMSLTSSACWLALSLLVHVRREIPIMKWFFVTLSFFHQNGPTKLDDKWQLQRGAGCYNAVGIGSWGPQAASLTNGAVRIAKGHWSWAISRCCPFSSFCIQNMLRFNQTKMVKKVRSKMWIWWWVILSASLFLLKRRTWFHNIDAAQRPVDGGTFSFLLPCAVASSQFIFLFHFSRHFQHSRN